MSEIRLSEKPMDDVSRDLAGPADVADLVRRFYGDVAQDEILGPMFNDVAKVDWSDHIPKLTAFWSRTLFGVREYGVREYTGNPFQKHTDVHAKQPFTPAHFHRWLELFHETVDSYWTGPNAEHVKKIARNVAEVHSGQLLGQAVNTTEYQ